MITRRRAVIALGAGAFTAPLAAFAQQQKVYHIGILTPGSPLNTSRSVFMDALRELGYVEGKHVVFEHRFAEGKLERLPALAAELVQKPLDVIYSSGTPSTLAAMKATSVIPIVFSTVGDPVGSGIVSSLARPSGNVTGTSVLAAELTAKRLQLFKEAFPKISRLAVLVASEPQVAAQFAEVQRAAMILGIGIVSIEVRRREDFNQVIAQLRKWRADSIYVTANNQNYLNRKLLADFAMEMRLPSTVPVREFTEAGGLMSYGPSYEASYRRAAIYIDKILKGAKPADLPVEQPTTFEFVINMKTAKSLGLKFPNVVMLRADKVIE